MARTMVVEHRNLGRATSALVAEGFEVRTVAAADHSTSELVEAMVEFAPDLMVIEGNVIDDVVLATCANASISVFGPIVVLCEASSEADVVAGYEAGAASILTEPIGTHEFVARVRALLRRAAPTSEPSSEVLEVGPVVLDPACRRLTVSGVAVVVPRKEFDIAEVLMRNAGALVSRRQLLDQLWGRQSGDTKSLDVQVGRLRARLSEAEGIRRIVTVRGMGYRFLTDADLERVAAGRPG